MTEQNFQAPPIPKAPTPVQPMSGTVQQPVSTSNLSQTSVPPPSNHENVSSSHSETIESANTGMITDLGLPPQLFQTKIAISILVGILFLGIILGSAMFGGGDSVSVQNTGLQGIVRNPEIKKNLARCGMADRTAACILYIVNASRNDRLAEDFFDEAVKLTGRQKYLLTIENSQYAKTRIAPGYFAQIKIPALK